MRASTLAYLRSSLAYLTLFFGAATFLPTSSSVVVLLACTVIFMGWNQLRSVARVMASLIMLVSGLALLASPDVLAGAVGNMASIIGLILSVMLLSATLSGSADLTVISQSLFRGCSTSRHG